MPLDDHRTMTNRRLSNSTLQALPGSVAIPRYDRDRIVPGIVHLGVGAFHRAHQAAYVDDCLAAG
jgi:fructuronate reductase